VVRIVEHGTWRLTAADEGLHQPGTGQLWNESYYYDFAAADGSVGGYFRLGLYPNWDRAWYWACLVRPGLPAIVVADNRIPLASVHGSAVRTAAINAAQQLSDPLEVAAVRLAATGAALTEPAAAYRDLAAAAPVRLAADLTWVTAGGVYPYKELSRYEIPCRVSGTVTVDGEPMAIDAAGERDHSWGDRDWWQVSWLWTSGRLDDGSAVHGMQANIGFPAAWPAFGVPPGGELRHLAGFAAQTEFGADGFPLRSRLLVPGAAMTAEPVAFGPVAMTAPDGRLSRFPRALCRLMADDGRTGYGWTEWNQPPGWRDHGWSFLGPSDGDDQG